MKRIVSGITSTGDLTLGNYIGAIKQFVELQKTNELIIFVANLHGITIPFDKTKIKDTTKKMVALYYACGLDPNKSIIFVQSDVLEHAQLAHILLCHTTIGELNRMTQFKDKSSKIKSSNQTNFIPTGILTYPTLMAADILIYNADYVPVGKDQKQHIELTRNIAQRMNEKYGKMFTIPKEIIAKNGSKIMNLQDPTKKMSKSSSNPKSYIKLLDSENEVIKKIKNAVTDSENKIYYNIKNKPGISNLMTIYSVLKNNTIKEIENKFKNKNYGEFKNEVAKIINIKLQQIQKKYNEILNTKINSLLLDGAEKAKKIAAKNLSIVQKKIGIDYRD